MRVITGKYKGRNLVAPKGETRPTLDRMKETLFNILNPLLSGATVLDLFAGSGQLAIECLSRGAEQVVLCDNSKDAAAAIKTNFDKIGEKPQLYFGDFRDCLNRQTGKFDIIFVDPPYNSGYYLDVLKLVSERQLLNSNGVIVCEYDFENVLPQEAYGLVCVDIRKLGRVKFGFYKRREQCE